MGIINVTPDSFSDGGRYLAADAAVAHGRALADAGASLLDVGGESTRPGATPVDEAEERARVVPVVERLAGEVDALVSIDTTKPTVAAAALDAGAVIVNDVSAGRFHPGILEVVADRGAGYVVMHMQGQPRTMQEDPRYGDVVGEVGDFLLDRLRAPARRGSPRRRWPPTPGSGSGRPPPTTWPSSPRLPALCERVEVPVLVGPSRKRFLGALLDGVAGAVGPPPPERARRRHVRRPSSGRSTTGLASCASTTRAGAAHAERLLHAMQVAA